jgi:DNA repair protein RecO (recombination protein O)
VSAGRTGHSPLPGAVLYVRAAARLEQRGSFPKPWPCFGALLEGSWSETRQMPDHVAQEASGIPSAFAAWHVDRNLRSLAHVEC